MKATIALADDHVLLRNGLANLLKELDYEVLFEADNGQIFLEKLKNNAAPQITLMDINMPVMDGYETALYLKHHYPEIQVLALSMYDDENAIIRMLRNGAKGYILKDCDPSELKDALNSLLQKGFYYSESDCINVDAILQQVVIEIWHNQPALSQPSSPSFLIPVFLISGKRFIAKKVLQLTKTFTHTVKIQYRKIIIWLNLNYPALI